MQHTKQSLTEQNNYERNLDPKGLPILELNQKSTYRPENPIICIQSHKGLLIQDQNNQSPNFTAC